MSKALNEDIKSAYQKYVELSAELTKISKDKAAVEKELDIHKGFLMLNIKAGEVKAAIYHKQTQTTSISYAIALTAIKEHLIPKTKLPEVDVILDQFTGHSTRDSFETQEK